MITENSHYPKEPMDIKTIWHGCKDGQLMVVTANHLRLIADRYVKISSSET